MTGIIKGAISPVVGIAKGLIGGSPKIKLPGVTPVATRDDAADAVARDDEIRRRKGSASNMLLGSQGAEAAAGTTATKMLTGQ